MEIDRLSPCRRPENSHIGYQNWRQLLFVHWRFPAKVVADLLPEGLMLDTFDGDAWVGLIPFTMHGIRPRWAPALPKVSRFHETNVRTYVHHRGARPGVWFFSLDATQSLAVRIARWKWHLPYFRADLTLKQDGSQLHYSGQRHWPEPRNANYSISARVDDQPASLADQTSAGLAIPGSLTHFLVERYFLYSGMQSGRLFRGQVHHRPYKLYNAQIDNLSETLLPAAGISGHAEPDHVLYSPGVDTHIYPLRPV